MDDPVEPKLPAPSAARPPWAKTVLWLGIILILSVNALIVLKSCRDLPGDTADKVGRAVDKAALALATVAAAFNQGKITTEFISYATSIHANHYLQFATLRQTEIFTRKDEASTAFGYVPLPDVIVEARAPVEFTYYLDLNARWQLRLHDGVVYALAPEIHFNKPSVDASAISYEVKKDSAIRDTTAAKENLKKSITALSHQRARENIALVRETGRKQTAEFVEKWLLKSFADGKKYPVKVYFSDEPPPPGGGTDFAPPALK